MLSIKMFFKLFVIAIILIVQTQLLLTDMTFVMILSQMLIQQCHIIIPCRFAKFTHGVSGFSGILGTITSIGQVSTQLRRCETWQQGDKVTTMIDAQIAQRRPMDGPQMILQGFDGSSRCWLLLLWLLLLWLL